MAMKALRDGAAGGIGKFILMGFMAMAVGGLVMMDMGGFFRGGVSSSDVAKVGSQKISAQGFDLTVRRTLGQIGITPDQAYQFGYIHQILGGEINARILNQTARDLGIRISDDVVLDHIKDLVAPIAGANGDIKTALDRILMAQGMSEAAFVAGVKQDMMNSLISDSIQNAVSYVPDSMVRDLYLAQNETRDIQTLSFPHNNIADIAEPEESDLRALYDMTRDLYAIPETRDVVLISLNQDALLAQVDVSDEILRAQYDQDMELYTVNQQWTLEQTLFDDSEMAQKFYDAMIERSDFQATLESIDTPQTAYLGERVFEETSLPDSLKDSIMAAAEGDITAPVQSPLGWYVVRVTSIQPAGVQDFESVKDEIRQDIIQNALADVIYEKTALVDDLFAAGTPIEEITQEAGIVARRIENLNRFGQADNMDALKEFSDIKGDIIDLAFDYNLGEASPMQEITNGKFLSVYVDDITEESHKSFEDVLELVKTRWVKDQKKIANRTRTKKHVTDIQDLEELVNTTGKSIKNYNGLKRNSDDIFPAHILNTIFSAPVGKPFMFEKGDEIIIASVRDVNWPENVNDDALSALKKTMIDEQKQEAMEALLVHERDRIKPTINDALLQQMYGVSGQ